MRVCICGVQVPFARGGSELLIEALGRELRARHVETETVLLPFKWYPDKEVLSHALAWRLIDLTESQGRPIDLVVATKFPSYLVRHPRKVLWLFHQFRQAYDLRESPFAGSQDPAVLDAVRRMDARAFSECAGIYTISKNVSGRLLRYNQVESTHLYPPPPLSDRYRCEGYGDFIFCAGRLESMKRLDLLLRAVALSKPPLRCVIAGTGPEAGLLKRLAGELGIEGRVEFPGWVSDESLLEYYATCRAVYYAPYDEDYGFTTLEAFRSRKPVLTASDSGGVLEWVTHRETGLVTAPEPAALAAALDVIAQDEASCRRWGGSGWERARHIDWEPIIDRLLTTAP